MKSPQPTRLGRSAGRAAGAMALAGLLLGSLALPARADEADAKRILKAMSDYMVAQKTISFDYDANLEILTNDLQKIGLASSGSLTLDRPDKIHVTRTGGAADLELAFDGKTVSVLGKRLGVFAQAESAGSVEDLVDRLRSDYGLELPAADLLSADPYSALMADVTNVKDLGFGVIDGKACDHFAFRAEVTDWQIWIAQGDSPYPCRFTITSKLTAQGPTYTLDVRNWKAGEAVAAGTFELKAGDAKQVDMDAISGLDESQAASQGDKK